MNDTVTRLMALADQFATDRALAVLAHTNDENAYIYPPPKSRQALQYELQKLFTPLSDEWFREAMKHLYGIELMDGDYADDIHLVRAVEAAHGIGEKK